MATRDAPGTTANGPGPVSPASGHDGSATPPTSPPVSSRPAQTITSVDLGSQTYVVGAKRRTVTLHDGSATDDLGRVTRLRHTVYSDANGDGFSDAAIELTITDGRAFQALWYIVTWDPGSGTAVQIADPFGRTTLCGDVVDSVRPATRGFTIKEHRTEGSLAICADRPPIGLTRTVAVRDTWLIEVTPHHGYGRICPQMIGDDGSHAPPRRLRIAPDKTAPVVQDKIKGAWLIARPEHSRYAHKSGWMLVGYSTTRRTETWYSSCAWMPLQHE